MSRNRFALLGCGAAITVLMTGCAESIEPPPSDLPSTNEALTIQGRVLDCELKAANRYDNGHSTITDVAERVIATCYDEIIRAWTAFKLSPSDPNFESDNFKIAVEHVEMARQIRRKEISSSN
jgi:hypothetical protein